MRIAPKILLCFILLFSGLYSGAQSETYLLPFGNRVEINPSLAGLNKNNSYHTGNQYYFVNSEQTYNRFYASWDSWSDKLKGGVALNFSQGMISERNINTTSFGFSYSGFPIKTNNGKILFSVGTNIVAATKQWTVAFLDQVITDENDVSSLPGKTFLRYSILKPQIGFLWTNNNMQLGLTAAMPYRVEIATDAIEPQESATPASLTLYISKKIDQRIRDLYSRPFRLSPELVVFYHEEYVFSRLQLLSEHTDKTWGFFVQNDYTNNIHTLGGTIGYQHNFMRFNLNAGMGIPGISDHPGFLCELSLNIVVPPTNNSKNNPWAPRKN
ncbi:type IX secretion system membrane protein PorP/SprF [Draconibacterium halophilum]|uniref:Type IX secretion system membrane protein PorP/SprF n=1 Tax=Draconibacterium halophilum TaxID=2706887 RepID=A0A6C0REM2_9BACT|nr:type IX secretion system membrane protein PorP/SprF [Draconibacterium halophilum]QIA08589.1 type IX secretion system membrane protein PorP/SprF [Draconibacterium halophilum]